MYKIIVSNKAIKEINNLPDRMFLRVDELIQSLSKQPRSVGSIKLTDKEEYRIRVGDYRLIYTIEDDLKEIHIYKFLHRKDIYRRK